jgi:hypothetical protein
MSNAEYLQELQKLIIRHFEDACKNRPEADGRLLEYKMLSDGKISVVQREELSRMDSISCILRTAEAMRRRLPPGQLLGQYLRSNVDQD